MAQRPKEHVRAAIVAAAASLFAEQGYAATSVAAIAERAGTSTGNVYKYFRGKDEVLAAVVPADFAATVRRMTRRRIEALGAVRDVRLLAPDAKYHVLAGELLDLCIAHRERVVILLGRAEGTPFEGFAQDFAAKLVRWALAYARRAWPELTQSAPLRYALARIYDGFLRSIADAFVRFRDEAAIREAVRHLTAHHQGGLKHLFLTAAGGET